MNRFWNSIVCGLTPYVPGEQPKIDQLIKLNTNENPYPPSEKVAVALASVTADSLRLYPDPESVTLREAIGRFWGVDASHVFVGNGSDEVLAFVFQGLLKQDSPLIFPDITYSFYPSYCRLYGIEYSLLALDDDFLLDLKKIPSDAKAVIFPNPNAPTGRALGLKDIESLLKSRPNLLVVIDEAYVDFGGQSCAPLTVTYPNLLVTQSLSKSRALAGLRIGFAIANPELIEALSRIKNSFNSYPIDRLASAAAIAAMDDREWFNANRNKVIASRTQMAKGLKDLGFDVIPSEANFLFVRHPKFQAAQIAAHLRDKRILVRHFAKPRIDEYLRITVGTDAQVDALLKTLRLFIEP